MKNFKKGFTLVEMLIVVVIIGILAAAILPRLTGAQAATRDAAREKGLTDLVSAIEMYQAAKGEYPAEGPSAANLTGLVDRGYIKSIPADPSRATNAVKIGDTDGKQGEYTYKLITSNGGAGSGAYILAAHVETLDKANAIIKTFEGTTKGTKVSDIILCDSVDRGTTKAATASDKKCQVADNSELLFVLIR